MGLPFGEIKTIVVVKLRAIGDAVIATPVVRALKDACPQAAIVVVTTPASSPIFTVNPHVDVVKVYRKRPPANLWSAWRLIATLREMKPDLVVNLHASFHSAWLSRCLGAPRLVVHNHSGENFFSTVPITTVKEPKSAIERDLDAVRALGIHPEMTVPQVWIDPRDAIAAQEFFIRHHLKPEDQTVVAINPGASRATKRWPLERFAGIARTLLADPKVAVVVLGGPGEEGLARGLQRLIGERAVVATNCSILQIAAMLARCRVLIGNDAGTHHLAAALGIPSVTIFGPELPREWHPYNPPRHTALTKQVHCVNCGLSQCDRLECLYTISEEDVVEAVRRTLSAIS